MNLPRITRSYRIDPTTWKAATAKAAKLGMTLSAVIDRFLRAWVAGAVRLPAERVEFITDHNDDEEGQS